MEPRFAVGQARWIFEDYLVYANNRNLAEQIRERARSRRSVRALFGTVQLPAGTGYWVKIVGKQ